MKVKKANCGASVKAANGGYMKVKKTGYNQGGAVSSKAKSDTADKSKYAKRAEGVKAAKGGAVKKKVSKKAKGYAAGGTPETRVPVSVCNACTTPGKCASAGRCSKSGKALK